MYRMSKNMLIYISDTTYHHVRNRTFVDMTRVLLCLVFILLVLVILIMLI